MGDRARVKFRAKGEEVRLDHSVLIDEAKAAEQAAREQFDAISSAPPESVPDSIGAVTAAFNTALADAKAKMEEYQAAKEAGDTAEAARLLAEGKRYNDEQVRLGAQLKRLQG